MTKIRTRPFSYFGRNMIWKRTELYSRFSKTLIGKRTRLYISFNKSVTGKRMRRTRSYFSFIKNIIVMRASWAFLFFFYLNESHTQMFWLETIWIGHVFKYLFIIFK